MLYCTVFIFSGIEGRRRIDGGNTSCRDATRTWGNIYKRAMIPTPAVNSPITAHFTYVYAYIFVFVCVCRRVCELAPENQARNRHKYCTAADRSKGEGNTRVVTLRSVGVLPATNRYYQGRSARRQRSRRIRSRREIQIKARNTLLRWDHGGRDEIPRQHALCVFNLLLLLLLERGRAGGT